MKWPTHSIVSVIVLATIQVSGFSFSMAQEPVGGLIDLPGPKSPEIIGFERHQFRVERVRGKVRIDGRQAENDAVENGRKELRLIEVFDQLEFANTRDFLSWAKRLRGPRTYTYDDVLTRNADGMIEATPLVLLPQPIREVADVEWRKWLDQRNAVANAQQRAEADAREKREHYRTLETIAQNQAAATANVANALTSSRQRQDNWLVHLSSGPTAAVFTRGTGLGFLNSGIQFNSGGFLAQPTSRFSVRVSAADSRSATRSALAIYPGYHLGGVSKVGY